MNGVGRRRAVRDVARLLIVFLNGRPMTHGRALRLYLLLAFGLGYFWQLVIFFTGRTDSPVFPFVMMAPAASAIVTRLVAREGFRGVGWGLRRWQYGLPALLVPLMVVAGVAVLLVGLGWATPAGRHFVFHDGGVDIRKVGLAFGTHTQGIRFFAVNLVVSLFGVSLVGSVFTLGEEFGWQGYLLPKLLERFNLTGGLMLLGVIWGYWHLPLVLMGYNVPAHPVLGALLLMPLGTIGLGIFQGWLYLRSRCIWMPTLAHASTNTVAGLLFTELIVRGDEIWRQLAWIAAWGCVAACCLVSLNRKSPVRASAAACTDWRPAARAVTSPGLRCISR